MMIWYSIFKHFQMDDLYNFYVNPIFSLSFVASVDFHTC